MKYGLNIKSEGALDFLSLGALEPPSSIRGLSLSARRPNGRSIPAAASTTWPPTCPDCFRLRTGIVSAMVDYPIGDLIAERVRRWVITPSTNISNTTG